MEISVTIKKVFKDEGSLRACGDIIMDGEFVVHGVRVVQGPNGLFAAMPSEKFKNKKFRDICHPISAELRDEINEVVLAAYQSELEPKEPK